MFKREKTNPKENQKPQHTPEFAAIIKDQATSQTDGSYSNLFGSAFAHAVKLPEMCEGYKALNARLKANQGGGKASAAPATQEERSVPMLTSDLPTDGAQPILH